MSRIVLNNGRQKNFLDKVHKTAFLAWTDVAKVCHISERTLRDWRREKFFMKYESAQKLSKETSVPLDKPKAILPDYWSTKKAAPLGGRRRYELYGNPGTPEGRKKGGIISQRKFRNNPEYAMRLGIKVRKIIKKPKNSPILSEFIGILLGDGGITDHQVTVAFNRETDKEHSIYIQKLVREIFGISSSIISYKDKGDKADRIVISSKNLVEFLFKKGLKNGNKMHNKIDIPCWIKNKKEYKVACIRGLMDTDGSFYFYKHRVNNKIYKNFAICFTSYSTPLLNSFYRILKELKFKPSRSDKRVYLHRRNDVRAYMKLIGSRNRKHINKYNFFKKGEVRKWL